MTEERVGLLEFAAIEYDRRGWTMPDLHVRIYDWLERTTAEPERLLRVFRGAGKSTVVGIYNAWRFHRNPMHQILVQGADDPLALDLSRDSLAIAQAHPLTEGMVWSSQPSERQWWTVEGHKANARTPQMRARGIMSTTVGSRADEIQNDDVEVPKNCETEPLRKKLRGRLSQQTHILKPGGSKLFVGTPHTHDSIYDELERRGVENLTIRLFAHGRRYESAQQSRYAIPGPVGPDGLWVFMGIGAHANLLEEDRHFCVVADSIVLLVPCDQVLDVYTGNAWPQRFDRRELHKRRRACRTLNEWDSQYQLEAKPLETIRLDPQWMRPYDREPSIRRVNGEVSMQLGDVQIVSATLHLDPASGKPKSDVSALCMILQDERGHLYWHRALGLSGELADVDQTGVIRGGQVEKVCDLVEKFELGRVMVETNGIGGHVPSILRGALRRRNLPCGVTEKASTGNKNKRILNAFEPVLRSGYLHVHSSVLPVIEHQMRDWNPSVADQPDDYLDAAASAIVAEPVRIGKLIAPGKDREDYGWQGGGVVEYELDYTSSESAMLNHKPERGARP
jgi:hypothetical protein